MNRVYYFEGLNHNLFLVGQLCDVDLEVVFRKSTCFVRDLQGNDLLTGNHGSNLYTISLQETTSSTPICLMAKASPTQAWLWHRRLSYLNFDYINLLSKKDVMIGLPKLKYVKDQLCSSCEAEAITTACYTQNRSIIIPTHDKMAYHIINERKPSIKHRHIFGCTYYLTRDGENPDKIKEKGDPCILVGYSTYYKGYRVYNKRTRLIVESIHLRFDKIKDMSETSAANDTSSLVPQRQKALDYDNSSLAPQLRNVSLSADTTVSSQQELDLHFGPLYDEFFNAGIRSCVLSIQFVDTVSRGSFDVIVGMDWLSKRKFVIVCHEKVVRIPLEGDEILRVHGERTQGVVKTLMNTKFRVDLVPGAMPVAKSPYRLAPLEMQELSEQLQELQDEVHLKLALELLRKEMLYAKSSVKDKILATSSETSKVENTPTEMLPDLDQQMKKRADDGKANVVTDALSRKERVKPRRVLVMAMTIQYGVRGMILAAKSEAFKQENVRVERLHGLD
ncbi:retrovirus-related pol polyprotein from transposon TNT 1-94 [Tanacetum coccineum]